MTNITVNGVSLVEHLRTQRLQSQVPMTEAQHQARIVRSVNRWNYKPIRNHSGAKTSKGHVIFSAALVKA